MNSNIEPHERIREYLLGKSTSENAALVEDRLLTDNDLYQELLIVEDELMDQYLAGMLADSEKEPFEKHFLTTPERRAKLRFARNLKKYVSRAEADRAFPAADTDFAPEFDAAASPAPARRRFWPWSNPILAYSLAGAAVLMLAVAAAVIIRNLNSQRTSPGKVLAVELTPGLSRGDEGARQISVSGGTATLQLQLRIPNSATYQTYRAILQTTDGREISRRDDLRRDPASNDRIIFPIPANLLSPGDYNLRLGGFNPQGAYEDVGRYYFRVNQ